jgi:hypothetical protein
LAAHSGKNMIGSTFWVKNMIGSIFWGKKHEWQPILGKNIIVSTFCG